jgi:hypothetical protein
VQFYSVGFQENKMSKVARKGASGEVVIFELGTITYVSEPLNDEEIGYRIGDDGMPEVSGIKVAEIDCEMALNELDDAERYFAEYPSVLREY